VPNSETLGALQQAAQGLTYQSETDAPWQPFWWPAVTGEPTAVEVRRQGRHKPDAPIEEQTIDAFFAPLVTEQDWYGAEEKALAAKYRALLDVVKARLQNAKAFRIGERTIAVYVIGVVRGGGWAGLKTTAVET